MQKLDFTAWLRSAIESIVDISLERLVRHAAGRGFVPLLHKLYREVAGGTADYQRF
jgi:hypothetical protein